MAKLIAKRVLSMMLVMIFVFTTFCFADLGFTSVALADKQGLITSGRPTVEFYVPETIYLKPGTTNTYQYFADEDADGNVINNVADDTEGNFSFRSSVPFSTLTITRSDDPNVTYTADNTSLLTGSFRTGNAAAGTLVEWRAEYVIEDRTYESFAYSYVYATSLDQSGLLWFQSHSGDMFWWDTNPYVGAYLFLTGMHGNSGGNMASKMLSTSTSDLAVAPLIKFDTTKRAFAEVDNAFNAEGTETDYFRPQNGGGVSLVWNADALQEAIYPVDGQNAAPGSERATITVDKSRYTDYIHIPYLSVGYLQFWQKEVGSGNMVEWIQSAESFTEGSGNASDAAVVGTPNITAVNVDTSSYKDNEDDGYQLRRGLYRLTGAIPQTSRTDTIYARHKNGNLTAGMFQASIYCIIGTALTTYVVDKSALRDLAHQASGTAIEVANDYEHYTDFRASLREVYKALGNPATESDGVALASGDMEASIDDLSNDLVELPEESRNPGIVFYVPETIYLDPQSGNENGMDTFRTYVDRGRSAGSSLRTGSQSEGYIYFFCPKEKARVTSLTCEGASVTLDRTTSSLPSLSAKITAGTLDTVLASGARKITWTLTYKPDYTKDTEITIKNYTMVYAPYLTPVVAAARWASNIRTSSLAWISGIHRTRADAAFPPSYYPRFDAQGEGNGKRIIPLLEPVTEPENGSHLWSWDWLLGSEQPAPVVKGQTIDLSAQYVQNTSEEGSGGGERGSSARSANGTLVVDSSRYTNVSQIPNVTSGFLVSQTQPSGDSSNANVHQAFYYYIGDYTDIAVGGNGEITAEYGRLEWTRMPNAVLAGDRSVLTDKDHDSTDDWDTDDHKDSVVERVLQADGPIRGLVGWNVGDNGIKKHIIGSHAYTYSRQYSAGLFGGWNTDWTNRSFNSDYTFLDCYCYDKSALRNAVQDEINKARNEVWYTAESWAAYDAALTAAIEMLGRPDYPNVTEDYDAGTTAVGEAAIAAVIADLQTASTNLDLPNARTVGVAYVDHCSTRAQADGTFNRTVIPTEERQFLVGDKVWAAPEDIPGYTYSGYYTQVQTQTVPDPPGVAEGTPAPIEFTDQTFYKWVFYYDPVEYSVTYLPTGGVFNGTAGPSTEPVRFDDPYTVGTHVGGGTDENPTAPPVYAGHAFTGWSFVDMQGQQLPYAHGASYGAWDQASNSQVFLAQWAPYTYTIRFAPGSDTESGTAMPFDTPAAYDDPFTLPDGTGEYAYTRTGYTHAGWAIVDGGTQRYALGQSFDRLGDFAESYVADITDPNLVETANGIKTLRNGQTITLYPAWAVKRYELSFDNEFVFTRDMTNIAAHSSADNVACDAKTGMVTFDSTGANALLTPSALIPVKARHAYRITFTTNAADPRLRLALYADAASTETDSVESVASGDIYVSDGEFPFIALQFGASSAQTGVTYSDIRVQDITNPVEAGKSPSHIVPDDVAAPAPGRVWKDYGSPYTDLPTVSRTGYTFEGWFSGRDAFGNGSGVRITENDAAQTMPASFKQLWSKWSANTYTVRFDPNGGCFTEPAAGFTVGTGQAAAQSKTVTFGEAYDAADGNNKTWPTAARSGYTFGGWLLDPADDTPVAGSALVDTAGDHTLTAKWIGNRFKVTYYNAGTEVTPQSALRTELTCGEAGELKMNGTADGQLHMTPPGSAYVFAGWAAASGNTVADFAPENGVVPLREEDVMELYKTYRDTDTNMVTLYAVWTPLECRLVVKGGAVLDEENNVIYGLRPDINERTLLAEYLDVVGSGEIRVLYTAHIGTGVTVQVVDRESGAVVETHTLVIFGDADGDGIITQQDINAIKGHVSGAAPLEDPAQLMAADMDCDGEISMQDIIIIKSIVSGAQDYNQAERKIAE